MSSALTSALSGLRVHQFFLDVVGNNLANASTVGYHASRVTFSDVLAQSLRSGSAPTSTLGGVNPVQIGLGVQIHSVDIRGDQGVLDDTGRPFDLGIQGDGFFVLNSGARNVFTRAGTFGVDRDSYLVDTSTGFRVRSVIGSDIQLPLNTLLPAKATGQIGLGGNLPAKVGGPVAEVLTSSSIYEGGTHAEVAGSATGPFSFTSGDTFELRVDGNAAQTITFTAADFTAIGGNISAATAVEVAQVIAAQASGVTVDGSSGSVVITSDRTGDSSTIKIDDGTGAPASLLGLSTTLVSGVSSPATLATPLNDLADNLVDYQAGDQIEISGTDASGQAVSGTFVWGTDGTTLGDLITFADNLLTDATVALDASGNLTVTADNTGDASLSLSFIDDAANVGQTTFASHGFSVTTNGQGPDEVRTSLDVFDSRGLRHTVTLTMTRVSSTEWSLAAETDNPNDVLVDGSATGIRFNADGSFFATTGTGAGDGDLELMFDGLSATQSISLDFGTSGQLDGVTQLGDSQSLRALSQDGYAVGELVSMAVGSDGVITGSYSNGQQQALDQIAVAVFSNPSGLLRRGSSLFEESPNSGVPQLQTAGAGRAGTVFGGTLESSNVDVAEEFVRLIEAQRGFQANARVIKVSDELLNELVNIV
ncbi:MAG: flagellar hook-basal body complex protein [Planctomycetes bacterium]|nr:flagellar hook-basal body complex protein [Planctomycetota bacterium]